MDKANIGGNFPKVSIIIVTLNAAADLQRCLNSIYRQAYPNIEIIIMDGNSTDGTFDIVKANGDKIAFWQSEKDNGIYDAMNKALDHITGEWVYFLGSDDELLEGFSELASQLKDSRHIYYGRVYISGKLTVGPVDAYRHAKDTICHQAIIYPEQVFKKYRFNTRYKIAADHVLNMQCWADNQFEFDYQDVPVAVFNDTGVSMTKRDKAFDADKSTLIYKYHGVGVWARFAFRKWKEHRHPERYKKNLD